jgi:tetratricopeptide (TPR) repeat protein
MLADVLTRSENYELALEIAQIASGRSKEYPDLHALVLDTLATIYSKTGKCDAARSAWEQAIQLNPDDSAFRERLDMLNVTCAPS